VKAAVLHTPGEPPTFREHPEPVAVAGRSVVRSTAAPVVPLDLLCASGTSYFGSPEVPYVPGVQGVGVIERSEALTPGTRVWLATSAGMAPCDGSLAERCLVSDEDLVPLDTNVPDELVAALGLSAIAAWMALSWRAQLREGERVLVLGGGGVVGQSGIGAAKALGASHVVAVARSEPAQQRALEAGADAVVPLPGDAGELTAVLRKAGEAEFDVVLDPVFGAAATAAASVLADKGRLVNLGGASGDSATFSSALVRSRSASVLGYTNNSLTPEQRREALTAVLTHVSAGQISAAFETRPLKAVAQEWHRLAVADAAIRLVLLP
jgi:NADPH:quinone reductase-like Zn-dependent oxidoreductase